MSTVICFGDSNTYGYNPASGEKYTEGSWVDHLRQQTDWRLFNLGSNGREIPHGEFEIRNTAQGLGALVSAKGRDNITGLWIMLGSNDLLEGYTAQETADRMDEFLTGLQKLNPHDPIRLIAPVKMELGTWIGSPALVEESARLQQLYRDLASQHEIRFTSTEGWNIPLAFDGVHFTAEGHRLFAENIAKSLPGSHFME